jgi:predicted trehalose synthase
MVLSALVPGLESAVPQNFRADLNVDTVDARLRETQEKLTAWIAANPEYLAAYRDAVVQLAPASAAATYSHE